jgi:hypothetical protein
LIVYINIKQMYTCSRETLDKRFWCLRFPEHLEDFVYFLSLIFSTNSRLIFNNIKRVVTFSFEMAF